MRQSKSFVKSIKSAFDNPHQHGLDLVVTTGSGIAANVQWKSNRKYNTAPKIMHTRIDEDGKEVYFLENGNTQDAKSYDELWNPKKQPFIKGNLKL